MNEKIVVPYAPVLVESTRSIGYSFESALADIIDNSLGSNSRNVWIYYESSDNPVLSVIDNGLGMDNSELESAMRYGSRSSLETRESNDLGRFGLGLKTASMSQCRKLIVASKKLGKISAACWDLDLIIERNDWILQIYPDYEIMKLPYIDKLNNCETGTMVLWQNFDRIADSSKNVRKIFDEKISISREHISLIYHRFLEPTHSQDKVVMMFNDDKLTAYDPFLSNHPSTQPLPEEVFFIADQPIKVKPFVLPYTSKLGAKDKKKLGSLDDLRQNQGFYIYRNKRLIIWGTWFRLVRQHELNKLARIRVDIPNSLDSIWEIDVKKSTANIPDLIKNNLVAIVDGSIGRSERVYKYRGRKSQDDKIDHVWNVIDNRGSFQYKINRDLEMYKTLENMIPEDKLGYFESFIQIIESSFPFQDVYYRIAKNHDGVVQFKDDDEQVYQNALTMINQLKSVGEDVVAVINNLDKLDYFKNNPNVILRLREEFIHE